MRLLALALIFGTLGCGSIQTEYEWVQEKDGLAMKAPIVTTARVEWIGDTLIVREKSTDVNGKVFLKDIKWFNDGYANCSYFDADNWDCKLNSVADGTTKQHIRMVDGELKYFYWIEELPIQRKYRIFGVRLPL